MDRIQKTIEFVREKFNSSEYFADKEYSRKYRMEHTLRVGNIGKTIAENEGFDVEALTVACLLHDVSYCETFEKGKDDVVNHGRFSARIARPFIYELGFSGEIAEQMLYGIAIHVDGKADFPGETSHFVQSISDADNIDRFDMYRLHENLLFRDFLNLPLESQLENCRSNLESLGKYEKMKFATATATRMWQDVVRAQMLVYRRLMEQMENSSGIK